MIGECRGKMRSTRAAGDHHAGEDLDALLLALADFHVDADAVARNELGDVALERGFLDFEQ